MSYLSLGLENGDIVFDDDNRLKLINDIAQEYKILIETQFESDYRDPTYGFRMQELIQSNYDDIEELLRLYLTEAVSLHERTDRVENIDIERLANRRFNVQMAIKLKPIEEVIYVGSEFSV